MSDSNGYVYDPKGIDLAVVKQIKEVERGRIKDYCRAGARRDLHRGLQGHLDHPLRYRPALRHPERAGSATAPRRWLPTASWRCAEGANMPSTPEADRVLPEERRAVCARQGFQRRRRGHQRPGDEPELACVYSWTFEEVDAQAGGDHGGHLPQRPTPPLRSTAAAGDLVAGANIAGFLKVADVDEGSGHCLLMPGTSAGDL